MLSLESDKVQTILLTLHAVCVIWMTSVIWLVQVLVYPAFLAIEPKKATEHHSLHSARISPLVAPPMILQLFASILLVIAQPIRPLYLYYCASAVLLFASTALISVPIHHQLEKKWDEALVLKLIRTNWIRTLLWTLECAAVCIALFSPK